MSICRLALIGLALGCVGIPAAALTPFEVEGDPMAFVDGQVEWYAWTDVEAQRAKQVLAGGAGWVEYEIQVPRSGWYELWAGASWTRDWWLDGLPVITGKTSSSLDLDPARKWVFKEGNLRLEMGTHRLRYRRVEFPGFSLASWRLREVVDDPRGRLRGRRVGPGVVRSGEAVPLVLENGNATPTTLRLQLRREEDGQHFDAGEIVFAGGLGVETRGARITFPHQGTYEVVGEIEGWTLRPADLNLGTFAAVEVTPSPAPMGALQCTTVVDIDCVASTNGMREAGGTSRVVTGPGGAYRESSGVPVDPVWGLDGFAFPFDLPESDRLYRLRVEYPDDDRRTMGFWVHDGAADPQPSQALCGGVETGDHYPLSGGLQVHEAYFHPRNRSGLVVAVVNLSPGLRAAAGRIRVDRVDGPLPASEGPGDSAGRRFGYQFEEPGRWLPHFGGASEERLSEHLKTLVRWGETTRFLGANLLAPTVNGYQLHCAPSEILEGYRQYPWDTCRLGALVAERHGCGYLPELQLGGNAWFDRHTMGVWEATDGRIESAAPEMEARLSRDLNGSTAGGWTPFTYNALHPDVQRVLEAVVGETADRLADCAAFEGISLRLMLTWQWQGWSALSGLKWGYDDWTVAAFQQETGLVVPGEALDPGRFRERFDFLTGPALDRWIAWRCERVRALHQRLLARIREAKPNARLFLPFYGADASQALSTNPIDQLREMGIDLHHGEHDDGLVVLPAATYGRRQSTPVLDASKLDPLWNEAHGEVSRAGGRSFLVGSDYFEPNARLDWTWFGATARVANNDTTTPSGIHDREAFAEALAVHDVRLLVRGGHGWVFGEPAPMTPWLREYTALPEGAFAPWPGASDPVAVRVRSEGAGLDWYCVNRLPVPVAVELLLASAGPVTRLVDGSVVDRSTGGALGFVLDAYMVRGFHAEGSEARLTHVATRVSDGYADRLRPAVDFARELSAGIAARTALVELSQQEAEEAVGLLQGAVAAFERGEFAQVRHHLERLNLVRIYDRLGEHPPGLWSRRGGGSANAGRRWTPPLLFMGDLQILGDARGELGPVLALAAGPGDELWVASEHQLSVFGRDGSYRRSLRLVQPASDSASGPALGRQPPPDYLRLCTLRITPAGDLAASDGVGPVHLFDRQTGRHKAIRHSGIAVRVPALGGAEQFCVDADGTFYVVGDPTGVDHGVWQFSAGGAAVASGLTRCWWRGYPGGIAAADNGDVFVSSGDVLEVRTAAGALKASLAAPESRGLGAVDTSRDGALVVALGDGGSRLIGWKPDGAGGYQVAFAAAPLGGKARAVATLDSRTLAVGFLAPLDGYVVWEYQVAGTTLVRTRGLVRGVRTAYSVPLTQATPLKVRNGEVLFLRDNRLMGLTPGVVDRLRELHNPEVPLTRPATAFAVAADGALYYGANVAFSTRRRGLNLYRCAPVADTWGPPSSLGAEPMLPNVYFSPTDLELDPGGRLLCRWDAQPGGNRDVLKIGRRESDGTFVPVLNCGSTVDFGSYGLHVDPQGRLAVAGGGAGNVTCVGPDGAVLWRRSRGAGVEPDSVPLRQPCGITRDRTGRYWVSDAAAPAVFCFSTAGEYLGRFGRFGTIDDRGAESFGRPTGIACVVDRFGVEWLYVADGLNQRLKKFALADTQSSPGVPSEGANAAAAGTAFRSDSWFSREGTTTRLVAFSRAGAAREGWAIEGGAGEIAASTNRLEVTLFGDPGPRVVRVPKAYYAPAPTDPATETVPPKRVAEWRLEYRGPEPVTVVME